VFRSPAQFRSVWTPHDAGRSEFVCPPALPFRQPTLHLCLHTFRHRRHTHSSTDFSFSVAALATSHPLLPTRPASRPRPPLYVPTPSTSICPLRSRTKPIKGRSCRWGLVHCAVSSISRLQHLCLPSSSFARETEETFFSQRSSFQFPRSLYHLTSPLAIAMRCVAASNRPRFRSRH
jgi:hypothetical protein